MTGIGRKLRAYLWNIFIALDQLANAVLGGDPDETVSSRAAKDPARLHWRVLIAVLEFIDPGHTARAVEPDEGIDAVFKSRRR